MIGTFMNAVVKYVQFIAKFQVMVLFFIVAGDNI